MAGAVQRFSWHGHVAAHAHPSGVAGCASAVALRPRRFAGPFCGANHASWFADGFSGADRGAAGRFRELFSALADWGARNGFPEAEPPRVLGYGGLADQLNHDILNSRSPRHHVADRTGGRLLLRVTR